MRKAAAEAEQRHVGGRWRVNLMCVAEQAFHVAFDVPVQMPVRRVIGNLDMRDDAGTLIDLRKQSGSQFRRL